MPKQCRNPGCDNPRDPDGDGFRRQFCSARCEVKFDHLRADARDAQRSEEQGPGRIIEGP